MNQQIGKQRWMISLGVAAAVAVTLVTTSRVFASPTNAPNQGFAAQTTNPLTNTITVSGFGQAYGKPNVATIQLGVEALNADASKAIAAANTTIAAVTAALTTAGVAEADIQTQNFNLFSTNPPPTEVNKAPDAIQHVYQAQITLTVKVRDITKTGSIIDASLKAGVNSIYGLNFGIDDTTSLESDARTKAIADARHRAQELAKALGVTLGDPVIIQEGLSNGPVPAASIASGKGGGESQVSGGQLSVEVNLQITFAISK